MATIIQQAEDTRQALYNVGEAFAHALFPNQFEYYFFAFELEDDKQVTDRFIFPISPKSISISESKIANVQKTSGGVVNLFNTSYNPLTITIQGNFGRDFKLFYANKKNADTNLISNESESTWVDIFNFIKPFVNEFLYTGFGAFNELKRIIRKSTQLTPTGKPYKLIFYNLAFSEIYLVQILNFNPTMTNENNYIHEFSLSMQAISYYNFYDAITEKYNNLSNSIKSVATRLKTAINS